MQPNYKNGIERFSKIACGLHSALNAVDKVHNGLIKSYALGFNYSFP